MEAKTDRRTFGWGMVCLTVPAWLMFAVELIGQSRFDKEQSGRGYAINLGARYNLFAEITFAMLAISPFLIAFGWSKLSGLGRIDGKKPRALKLFLALSLLVSLLSCLWTCSGHPTWTGGYTD